MIRRNETLVLSPVSYRAAFLTGRYPWRAEGIRSNLSPPSRCLEGTNLGYTLLPERLKERGYATHHIGKWHQGFADYRYTPTARGFDTTDGFFGAKEDHFQQCQSGSDAHLCGFHRIYDVWKDGRPARELVGVPNDERFSNRAIEVIEDHVDRFGTSGQVPLFMYLAYNTPHSPIQALPQYLDKHPNISYSLQRTFYAMISSLDEGVKNVTEALKRVGLWENTLFIWQADNGSPTAVSGSNYPFRGGKHSNWEGGVRVPTLVNGGLLPDSQRGRRLQGIGHIMDWYSTCLEMAGIDPTDTNPLAPSPIDSVNLWPWISGQQDFSPRDLVVIDHDTLPNQGLPAYGAIRFHNLKLLVGPQPFASWYGGPENNYFTPNQSTPFPDVDVTACTYSRPCLYDMDNDPTEHNDLSFRFPQAVTDMLELWHSYDNSYHIPLTAEESDGKEFCSRLGANGHVVAPYTTVVFPARLKSSQRYSSRPSTDYDSELPPQLDFVIKKSVKDISTAPPWWISSDGAKN